MAAHLSRDDNPSPSSILFARAEAQSTRSALHFLPACIAAECHDEFSLAVRSFEQLLS
jgi:hypothetical protein